MRNRITIGVMTALAAVALGSAGAGVARAQDPILTPIVVSTVAPIVVKAVTPKHKDTAGLAKFEGFIMNANSVQVTVKAKGNDMAIKTFPLTATSSEQMLKLMDKGGYQYGDKVTIYYDPQTQQAVKIKGKPSKPL